jgi:hypothetical protein
MPGPGFLIASAFAFAESHGLTNEAAAIRSMRIHPSINRPSMVKKGALIELFESKGLIDEFVALHWPNRHTSGGEKRRKLFLQRKRLNADRLSGKDSGDEPVGVDDPEEPSIFALEAHLRDFIAANIDRLPIASQKLVLYQDQSGRSGVEYPTAVGPIDILAADVEGNFFVFELKVERGPDRALGQLARYMGWVKLNLAEGRKVAGIIVANSIDEKLRYAAAVFPGIQLLEYELSFKIRGVQPAGTSEPSAVLLS